VNKIPTWAAEDNDPAAHCEKLQRITLLVPLQPLAEKSEVIAEPIKSQDSMSMLY
jgi:hypothetical protein